MGISMAIRTSAFATVLVVDACLATYSTAPGAAGKPNAPFNPYDPCLLVTAADLQATFGIVQFA
jgi:hypothetical protein